MPLLLDNLSTLPSGSHALSFHDSPHEGAQHAAEFLRGSPGPDASMYYVADERTAAVYRERISSVAPGLEKVVRVVRHGHVHDVGGVLRPIREVVDFVEAHPSEMRVAGETLSYFWTVEDLPRYEEYEMWVDHQKQEGARILCPYDLRRVPVEPAPALLRRLGDLHGYVALSSTDEPVLRLFQAFLFRSPSEVPEPIRSTLDFAMESDWVRHRRGQGFEWTARGAHFAQVLLEKGSPH